MLHNNIISSFLSLYAKFIRDNKNKDKAATIIDGPEGELNSMANNPNTESIPPTVVQL